MGKAGVERWFDFLNLGYKLTPSAGSDAPYLDHHPGSVRNYVHVGKDYSVQSWFDNLKAGHTFVTNGPMLKFNVNDMPMGSRIKVEAGDVLTITAVATLNPDIERLHRLEIIEQGETVAQSIAEAGAETLKLQHRLKATHGTWFVLKGSAKEGRKQPQASFVGTGIVAMSAPIYVSVDGGGFCKPTAVQGIVADLKEQLEKIVTVDVAKEFEMEPWDTQEPREKHWPTQQAILKERVNATNQIYDEILRRSHRQQCLPEIRE
jgi:hypothetical protein